MQKTSKTEIWLRLLELNLAATPEEAKALVLAGKVLVNDQRVDKAGTKIDHAAVVRLKEKRKFVSRGGEKLWGAIQDLGLNHAFKEKLVLDIGASTGGFADCCLQLGARKILCVDIGSNQLDWRLRQNAKIVACENTDIRDYPFAKNENIDWILADIAFNSLAKIATAVCAPTAWQETLQMLVLVKPQFELNADLVPDGGVVSSEESMFQAIDAVKQALSRHGISNFRIAPSRIKGRKGNQEFFLYGDFTKKDSK